MFECDDEKIRRIIREELIKMKMEEQIKKEQKRQEKKKQEQEDDRPIPAIKIGKTVIQCDWKTRNCKILESDGTPISVGSDENWEGIVDDDTIKAVPRKKNNKNIE